MRFSLAAKKISGILSEIFFIFSSTRISEERFWRNYFYRVSLIKQSTQLTSLAAAGKLVIEVGNVLFSWWV